ncbi:hypothetical protein [Kineobactrum salinum]|uniref:Uncharacterized protein n=1 Tax=Kineobactrum salinum TaxID=2708301 RepID=A0A6C0U5J4_9GAMM|nr:hypothetical protein [Kineobactrum salinum]QIB67246.1 hypothetical protein G3T16_19420 [Kineobactrum salinum]
MVGNRITIRSRHVDGSSGHQASMRVGPDWRATIDGKQLRVGELVPGQVLTVYIPEDRFVLTLEGDTDGAEIVVDDKAPEQTD